MICTTKVVELKASGFQVLTGNGCTEVFHAKPFSYISQFGQFYRAKAFEIDHKLIGYEIVIAGLYPDDLPFIILDEAMAIEVYTELSNAVALKNAAELAFSALTEQHQAAMQRVCSKNALIPEDLHFP